jgi:hypothetical protein
MDFFAFLYIMVFYKTLVFSGTEIAVMYMKTFLKLDVKNFA